MSTWFERFVLIVSIGGLLISCSTKQEPRPGSMVSTKQEPRPDSMVSMTSERYELYAPTEEELTKAKEELDYAAEQFFRYFGEYPPKIAVVIFDSPEKMKAFDFTRFRAANIRVLPWISARFLQSGEKTVSVIADLGVVLQPSPAGNGVKVLSVLPVGLPKGADLKAGDVIFELNGIPIKSLKQLEDLYGSLAAGSNVELGIQRGEQKMTTSFSKPSPKDSPRIQVQKLDEKSPALQLEKARPLSHEAGHVFFMSYVDAKLGRTFSDEKRPSLVNPEYGHDLIPDWFDEAVATLCEFPALQDLRRKTMREKIDQRIPLSEFFTMEHPVAKSQRELIRQVAEDQKTGSGAHIIIGGEELLSNRERAIVFYAQALTFSLFLAEKEGPDFIAQIARGLMTGQPMEEILRRAKSVPQDLAALEKAWVEWLKK
jgi:hypothetical protein